MSFNIVGEIDIEKLAYIDVKNFTTMDIKYHPSWSVIFNDKRILEELKKVFNALNKIMNNILPPKEDIFNAFLYTEFPPKVVILGQDPYKNKNEGMGLAFSVNDDVKIPPSLMNIYKELSTDIVDFKIPTTGNLKNWAKQGVFLLNTALTLNEGESNSHQNIWKNFTNLLINIMCEKHSGYVFMLWGNNAKEKKQYINGSNKILESAHPSPLSVKGFIGNKHFSTCNQYLKSHGKTEINWSAF